MSRRASRLRIRRRRGAATGGLLSIGALLASSLVLAQGSVEQYEVVEARTGMPATVDGVPLEEAPPMVVVEIDRTAFATQVVLAEPAARSSREVAVGELSPPAGRVHVRTPGRADIVMELDQLSEGDRALLGRSGLLEEPSAVDGEPDSALAPPSERSAAPAPSDEQVVASLRERSGAETVLAVIDDWFAVIGVSEEHLAGVDGVMRTESDQLAYAMSDPFLPMQWHLENTGQNPANTGSGTPGMDLSWVPAAGAATGRGVVVAVIDTRFDLTHPDLVGRVWVNAGETCGDGVDRDGNGFVDDCEGWNLASGSGDVRTRDRNSFHGTHVATTIAAGRNGVGGVGVAPGATIMPLVVTDTNGAFPMSRVAAAIVYAVDNGADIINLSLGTDPGGSFGAAGMAAVAYAESQGVLLVAAAGNSSADIDVAPVWPASHELVLAVGAFDQHGHMSPFSNHGRGTVDVAAPGSLVLAGVPGGMGYASGTSMAAPQVTGIAALLRQREPDATPAAIRQAIRDTAIRLPSWTDRSMAGGRASAAGALGLQDVGYEVTFAGLGHWPTGPTEVVTEVEVQSPAEAALRITLAMWWDGAVYAVTDHPVTVFTGGASHSLTTDGEGAFVALQDTLGAATVTLTTELPDGDYVWLVEKDGLADTIRAGAFTVGHDRVDEGDAVPPPVEDHVALPPPDAGGEPSPPGSGEGTRPGVDEGAAPPPGGDDAAAPSPGRGGGGGTPPAGDGGASPPVEGGGGAMPPAGDGGASPPPGTVDEAVADPDRDGQPTLPPEPGGAGSTPPSGGGGAVPTEEDSSDGAPPRDGGASMVTPSSGGPGMVVTVKGGYPAGARVRFAESSATVMHHDAIGIVVKVPQRTGSGPVDVSVRTAMGVELVRFPGAFTYTGGSALPPVDGGGSPPPIDHHDGTSPPPPSVDEPPDSGGSAPPGGDTGPSPRTIGDVVTAPNGLRVVQLGAGHPGSQVSAGLWAQVCAGRCPGRVP